MNAVIVCDSGWQYRLEIWKEMNRNNNTRSGLTTVNIKIIGSSVIGADVSDARINHLAFNISAIPKKDLSSNFQDATDHVRLYILK